ncbi:hypothetical protein [Lacticaseibacillus paracasei]|uniref:hypothetical protein n=1 Tax=Lacticaseibacillus paracasei TaxID=1597 RepID=UPI0003439B46|nr:hypothetical protein [Lacticaseibacillus paracasei]EPC11666.1 putative membrane protein [Lacticaseibacillus paracasei subsp. paracasei Lpp230]MCT3360888.1 hypothetical protein [Lacticaseibacillus paracasei]MDC6272564.1 hypothetical protein [Lacticaseibacillus paracasei]MDN4555326.1 hypothetical protein [Lacticaseibacillus paracasei]MDP0528642.1 hypothetical protein [Lacticaseibacillus paracasei]
MLDKITFKLYLRFSILGMLLWAQHTSEDQTGKIALSLNGGYILFFLGGMLHSPELSMIPIFLLIYGNANFIKHIKGDEPYLFSNVGSLLIMTVCFATIFLMKSRYAFVLIPLFSLCSNSLLVSLQVSEKHK